MSIKTIIDIPLNTIEYYNKWNNYKGLTKEWIDYRIDIFMMYTVKSIINQTDQSFLCVVHYLKDSEDKIKEALSRYPRLPDNIIFSSEGSNLIKEAVKGYDYVYQLRIGSDDVIHPSFIEQLKKIEYYEGLQCVMGRYGYIYDVATNRLAIWDHDSPAFNAYTFNSEKYIENNYVMPYEVMDHMQAKYLNNELLLANNSEGRSFIIIIHEKNLYNELDHILSVLGSYCPGFVNNEEVKKSILREFKIID